MGALAEVEVRAASDDLPISIYRPGVVVGDSTTGEIDKIDGPYYLLVPFMKLQAFTRAAGMRNETGLLPV